jgi:lambda repressor-like predicted transcriptional regulator
MCGWIPTSYALHRADARVRVSDSKNNFWERFVRQQERASERSAELAHEQQLAAIRLETERKLAAIRKGETATQLDSPAAPTAPEDRGRKAFVMPILREKGWSILDWANEAGVSSSAAHDYLANRRRQFASTRLKLAKALGISIQQLP